MRGQTCVQVGVCVHCCLIRFVPEPPVTVVVIERTCTEEPILRRRSSIELQCLCALDDDKLER